MLNFMEGRGTSMEEIITDNVTLVAKCGLYCGACGKYLSVKCPECEKMKKPVGAKCTHAV